MKNKILAFTLAAAVFAGGFTATQLSAADASTPAPGNILQRIADRLNLSPEQRTQIRGILLGDKDHLKLLLGQLHDARKNLRTAIRASDASEASVRAASAKVAAAESDLAVERMKLYGKIAPILTEAQRQQLTDLQQRADDFVDNVIARLSGIGG